MLIIMDAISVVLIPPQAAAQKKELLTINLLIVAIHLLAPLGHMAVVFQKHFHYVKKEVVGIFIKERDMILQVYLLILDTQISRS